jgi:transposase
VFGGPINGPSFQRYVEQFLLPTLKRGDFVIMDNPGSHKGEAVRAAIKSVGARLMFSPPYSPDLNLIEQVFSKLKHLFRRAKTRTVESLQNLDIGHYNHKRKQLSLTLHPAQTLASAT